MRVSMNAEDYLQYNLPNLTSPQLKAINKLKKEIEERNPNGGYAHKLGSENIKELEREVKETFKSEGPDGRSDEGMTKISKCFRDLKEHKLDTAAASETKADIISKAGWVGLILVAMIIKQPELQNEYGLTAEDLKININSGATAASVTAKGGLIHKSVVPGAAAIVRPAPDAAAAGS